MREDDMAVLVGPRHDGIVVGPDVSDPAPMDRLVSGIAEEFFPDFRDIHVQDDLHDALSGTSYSSARHDA